MKLKLKIGSLNFWIMRSLSLSELERGFLRGKKSEVTLNKKFE